MCKIFTFVPTNSLIIENHDSSLVLQSGGEVWSTKQVILIETLPMIYWPRQALTNPSILHATKIPIYLGSEQKTHTYALWGDASVVLWCWDALCTVCCRCLHGKFSHAHLIELYIHMLLTGVNVVDTISILHVWWFLDPSYPSPQIPCMDL